MKISDILKARGMFSKDIRIRLKNGQLQLNGEVIKEDIEVTELEINDDPGNEITIDDIVQDAGDFLFIMIASNPTWVTRCHVFGFENLFNSNIDNELTHILGGFNLLRISKRDLLVIEK